MLTVHRVHENVQFTAEMEDTKRDPTRTPLESSSVGLPHGVGTTGQEMANPCSEEALGANRRLTAMFESSEGRNVQQGSGNTMIVNYSNSSSSGQMSDKSEAATADQSQQSHSGTVWGVALVVVILGVLVMGYLYYTVSVQSASLPSIAPGFLGRENEVARLHRAITTGRAGGPSIVNIVGAPGFGKSALAIVVGHDLLEHGIYVHYADLNHLDDVKLAVNVILATVIDDMKSSYPQQLYRWAGKVRADTVVILDNCDSLLDDQTTRNLFLNCLSKLGGSSSKLSLLTTSRYQYTILDRMVETLELGPLRQNASEMLLRSMYNELTEGNASALAHLAGHNALALKVTGALLKEGVSAPALVKELRQKPIQTLSPDDFRPEDQVRGCIESSFVRLSKRLRVSLVTLAHIPGTFDEADATAILNDSNTSVHGSLTRQLRKRCLLEFDDKSKRYHLHSLIRAYGKDQGSIYIKSHVVERTVLRHHFRKLTNLAMRYNEEPLLALKLYDLDQQNFHDLLTSLIYPTPGIVDRGTINSKNLSMLAIKSAGLIHARVSPSRQVRWFDTAMTRIKLVIIAQHESLEENKDSFCQILCLLVEAMVSWTDVSAATREVHQHKRHVEDCAKEYRIRLLITLCFRGSTVDDTTEVTLECHKQMSQLLGFPVEFGKSFFHLGNFYHLAGHVKQAIACYMNYYEVKESQGRNYERPLEWSEHTVSMLETYKVNVKESVSEWNDWIESSFELMSDKFERSPQTAHKLLDLGITLYDVSMDVVALKVLLHTLGIQKEVFGENHVQTLISLRTIGHIHFRHRNYTLALQFYNSSFAISKRVYGSDSLATARLLRHIGQVLVYLGRSDAIDYLKQALEIKSQPNIGGIEEIELLLEIAQWYSDRWHPYTAFDYYTRAYRIAREHKKEKHVFSSAAEARAATGTDTALQTSDNSVSTHITSLLQFILRHSTFAIQLRDNLSTFIRTPHDENVIWNAYGEYYFRLFAYLLVLFVLAFLLSLSFVVCLRRVCLYK